MQVDMHEAKARLSRLGELALKGKIWIAPDFDETSPDVIEAFESSPTGA